MDRRKFLESLGGAALATTFAATARASQALTGSVTPPSPEESGIERIVVVTMENRSFDHFWGWVPGADGIQSGLSFTGKNGAVHSTYPLAPDYEGCPHPDPDHSYTNSRVAYDNGKMDGFLRAGSNDVFSIGYYTESDLPFYSAVARNYTVCDRYFAAILGPTFSNRMFLWAAQTDRLGDTVNLSSLTTIFDRLSSKGISHRYYFNNVPYLALWGLKYIFSSSLFSDFLEQAAAGTLPAVSFVDPMYTVLDDGTGNDDHPHADIRNGDAFLAKIFHTLSNSPAWQSTVLIVTFDEWGGFFEHVAPPRVVAANAVDTDQVNGQVLLGFRVPAAIISPFTQNTGMSPLVNHTVFDHTSILKLIEWRWGLEPLTPRDSSSDIGNLAMAMNFGSPSRSVPALPSPSTVAAKPCFGGGIFSSAAVRTPATSWGALQASPNVQAWYQHPRFQGLQVR